MAWAIDEPPATLCQGFLEPGLQRGGKGRVYTITTTASDLAGNTATVTGTCTVPHDKS